MAIATPTNIAAVTGGNVANASTYDTAVTILTAGRLYRLAVVTYKASTPAIPTTVTHDPVGTPLSFTLVSAGGTDASKVSFDSAAHRSLSVWQVVPGSTTASALIRITGMGSCSSCGWSLTEITSGFDATTPTTQVKVASGLQTSAIAVTMSAFADTSNLTTLVMGWGDGTANPAETIVATEGRTELEEHNDGERSSLGSDYQNPNGSDTSIGATLSASTVDWACIGIETAVMAAVTSTAALTIVPTIAGTATVINPVTSTAALTVVPAVVAAGAESLTSTAALTIVPAIVAAGQEKLTATGALTIVPAVTAAGAESLTSTAALTVVPSVVAAGAESLTSTAALTVTPSVVAAGSESLTSTATLTVTPVVEAAADVTGGGPPSVTSTAALTITPSIEASATATEAPSAAPLLGVGGGFAGGGTGAVVSKRQLEIERKVDELIDSLLTEPAAPVVEAAAPAVETPVPTPAKRAAPIVLPGINRIGSAPAIPEFVPPTPEPWLLQVPSLETSDDAIRMLLLAAVTTL